MRRFDSDPRLQIFLGFLILKSSTGFLPSGWFAHNRRKLVSFGVRGSSKSRSKVETAIFRYVPAKLLFGNYAAYPFR
ncbi:MAG: hypothetical protein DMG81_20155 [Acidobacteria bacterium]|nr:MAG: hypothetical protein DMG81_20155 [Acidobacteriota bacterium]